MRASTLLLLLSIALGHALLPFGVAAPQISDRGVASTANAIQQLDRVIAQNEEDLSKLFAEQGFKFMKAAGGEGLDWIKPLESGYTGFQAGKDLNAGRYAEALSEAAKIIADVWGELDPNVKLGKAGIEVAGDVYEAQSLLRQQAQLLGMRLQLEKQYYRLKGKSGLDLTQIDKIRAALDEDAKLHAKFLESLKQYGLDRQDVKSQALKNASARPGQGYQIASGMIVDPQSDVDSLAKIPGINPDFISSLRRQFELLQKGDLESVELAGEINKYDYNTPNWSYINIFGPGRGDTTSPTLGGYPASVEYKPSRTGVSGIVLDEAQGSAEGALLLDNTGQRQVGQLYTYGQKFSPGSYQVDFHAPGYALLPIEVRDGYISVVSAPGVPVYLISDDKRACVCLSIRGKIVTNSKVWGADRMCRDSLDDSGYYAVIAPGVYNVIAVDKSASGSCTNHMRAGYAPFPVTLQPNNSRDRSNALHIQPHSGKTP